MELHNIPIVGVVIPERLRQVDEAAVRRLAESMAELGLHTPITVWSEDDSFTELVAGRHRLEAAKLLGWGQIDAYLMEGDANDRLLWEIDENLCRAELTPADVSQHIARRQKAYEDKNGKAKAKGTQAANAKMGRATNNRDANAKLADASPGEVAEKASQSNLTKAFTKDTASKTGRSERSVQRANQRGQNIAQDVFDKIKGTRLDTGAYQDKLAKLDHAAQRERVEHDLAQPPAPRSPKAKPAPAPDPAPEPTPPAPETPAQAPQPDPATTAPAQVPEPAQAASPAPEPVPATPAPAAQGARAVLEACPNATDTDLLEAARYRLGLEGWTVTVKRPSKGQQPSLDDIEIPTPLYDQFFAVIKARVEEDGLVDNYGEGRFVPEDLAAQIVRTILQEIIDGCGPFAGTLGEYYSVPLETGCLSSEGHPIYRSCRVFHWYTRPISHDLPIRWIHAERTKADANRVYTPQSYTMDPPQQEKGGSPK